MEFRVFGDKMEKFYRQNHFKRGGSAGGDFSGKVIRQIISHKSLAKLSQLLGPEGDVYVKYLAALRELYRVCAQKQLKEDYEIEVRNFKDAFEEIHSACGLSETTKVHILSCHVDEFLASHGHTMSHLSDEPIETQHGRLRFFERKHNYVCRRNLLSKYKSIRSKASFDTFNTKHRMYKANAKLKNLKRKNYFD